MKPLFIIFFLTLWANTGHSQFENHQRSINESELFVESYRDLNYFERRTIAIISAKQLKKGTLVVRLLSKIEKIDKLIEMGRIKEATLVRKEMNKSNKDFIQKFKEYYTYSDVVFIYGYMLPDYLEGKITDIYLNEDLEIDPSIKTKEGDIFYFGAQATPLYYLLDASFNVIEAPGPYAIPTGMRGSALHTAKGLGRKYHSSRGIALLNKRLFKLGGLIPDPNLN